MEGVQLGLGLIGIGRRWGHVPGDPPPEKAVMALLAHAVESGVRYFDTAPSYGSSEARLGRFLRELGHEARGGLTIATKFGEHQDSAAGAPFVDHSYDALRRSFDRSLSLLGRIDVLQLHKTTPETLASDDLWRAWEYALAHGVAVIGPSVSDEVSAGLAIVQEAYGIIQLPYHRAQPRFGEAIDRAQARGMAVAVNRPFAMGSLAAGDRTDAMRFVLRKLWRGVVLSGTRSIAHLEENLRAFNDALAAP